MSRWPVKTIEQRFWAKVGPHDDPNLCWLWLATTAGGHASKRYGWFWDGSRMVYAHRFSYELLVEPISIGMTIDHVKARGCTSTLCVNPAHLELVTMQINVLRGDTLAASEVKRVMCPQGHSYDEENTYTNPISRKRQCRICNRESCRQYHAKKVAI